MQSEIKIHTFPFTKCGVIDANITNILGDETLYEIRGFGLSNAAAHAKKHHYS